MSAMRSNSRGGGSSLSQHNLSVKPSHFLQGGGSTDDLRPMTHHHAKSVSQNLDGILPVVYSSKARSPIPQDLDLIREETHLNINDTEQANHDGEFSSEVVLIQENQRLKKKLAQLKKVMLSDKNLKAMKVEVIEILNLLESIEDHLNHSRGIIKEDDFLLANFEDKFLREFNLEMEAEVITALDLGKIKKKALNVQRLISGGMHATTNSGDHVHGRTSPSLGSSIKYKGEESSNFLSAVGAAAIGSGTPAHRNEQDWLRYLQGAHTTKAGKGSAKALKISPSKHVSGTIKAVANL